MGSFLDGILINLDLFFLILTRVGGIFVSAPFFARNNLPATMKIGLAVLIAFILLPVLAAPSIVNIGNFAQLAYYGINELLIGIIIGFVGFAYFSIFYLAGGIIDRQIGFAMVNVLDPLTNTQMPIIGNFYNILFTLIFLGVNGHHVFIRALVYSYELMPIGFRFALDDMIINRVIAMMAEIFIMAFIFSAPIIAAIFLSDVLLGILSKTMPQMNVFVVGLDLKIMVGMVTIIITLQAVIPFSEKLFDRMYQTIYEIIEILSKG